MPREKEKMRLDMENRAKAERRREKKSTCLAVMPSALTPDNALVQTNLFKRVLLSVIMISGFLWICFSSRAHVHLLILLLSIFIIKEIIGVSKKSERLQLSGPVVLGFVVSIYFYLVFPTIARTYPSDVSRHLLRNLSFASFYCYIGTFMFFVASLRKDRVKSQLGLFALIHLSTYALAVVAKCAMFNVGRGMFWFVFPVLLVISNDISAYAVGKLFGKTPLYRLSPKKTLEGFLGAFVFTAVIGFALGYVHVTWAFLGDEYMPQMQKIIALRVPGLSLQVRGIYIHVVPFIIVASFVAPFSGFLASALKRAYKKKDFGEAIPGHGGVADRMDCQALIVTFTSMYITSLLSSRGRSIEDAFSFVCNNLGPEEIRVLLGMLNRRLETHSGDAQAAD